MDNINFKTNRTDIIKCHKVRKVVHGLHTVPKLFFQISLTNYIVETSILSSVFLRGLNIN